MQLKIISESPKETQQIAAQFIKSFKSQKESRPNQALVISLEGDLGSGKTEFLKGVAKELKLTDKVFSPTFILMRRFAVKYHRFRFLWHLDCYRFKNLKEIKELDFQEIIKDPQNIVCIEWGNKIRKLLPKHYWQIKFYFKGENKRLLEFYEKISRH